MCDDIAQSAINLLALWATHRARFTAVSNARNDLGFGPLFAIVSWGTKGQFETMQTAGWSDVWHLGLAVFSHQNIALQIFIGLMAALSALMIVEGLRANFFPQRRAEALKPATVTIETEHVIQPMPTRSFAATRPQMTHLPKRSIARARLQKAPRPAIKRMANTPTEIAAE